MKKVFALILILIFASSAFACTGVFVNTKNAKLIGRTLDWATGDGKVMTNTRGIDKTAVALQDKSSPAQWRSKYGSVTFDLEMKFNLIERLYMLVAGLVSTSGPTCGINEKGLWGGAFWIHPPPAVKYPAADKRGSLNDWQLLEYILDTSANVNEALVNINKVRVSGFKEAGFEVDLHWYIADPSGDSAIIEFPEGKLEIYRRPAPPVITNSFYVHTHQYADDYQGFGGSKLVPLASGETTSENRFLFAGTVLQQKLREGKVTVPAVYEIMKAATQTHVRHAQTSQSVTQWTTVYDLNKKELSWFSRSHPEIRMINLSDIDFDKGGPPVKI